MLKTVLNSKYYLIRKIQSWTLISEIYHQENVKSCSIFPWVKPIVISEMIYLSQNGLWNFTVQIFTKNWMWQIERHSYLNIITI